MTTTSKARPALPPQASGDGIAKPGEWLVRKNIALMKQRLAGCRRHECVVTIRSQLAEEESALSRILGFTKNS